MGSFEATGVSQRSAGSGVLFVGISDDSGDIKKLVFNTQEEGSNVPFAINQVSLRTSAVPEPSTLLGLLFVGTVGVVLNRNKN